MSKSTGFTPAQVRAIRERDDNRCAMCGKGGDDLGVHHRANRGLGGRKSMNRLSNGVLLHALENGALESEPEMAVFARMKGIKISSHDEPSHVPITHAVHGRVLLDDAGGVHSQFVPF